MQTMHINKEGRMWPQQELTERREREFLKQTALSRSKKLFEYLLLSECKRLQIWNLFFLYPSEVLKRIMSKFESMNLFWYLNEEIEWLEHRVILHCVKYPFLIRREVDRELFSKFVIQCILKCLIRLDTSSWKWPLLCLDFLRLSSLY